MPIMNSNMGVGVDNLTIGSGGHASEAAALIAWRVIAARTPGFTQTQSIPAGTTFYDTGAAALKVADGAGAWTALGAGGSGSLDDAYNNGRTIAVDIGAVVWNDTQADGSHLFDINKNGAGSGNLLDIAYGAANTGVAINMLMTNASGVQGIVIDSGSATMSTAGWALAVDSSAITTGAQVLLTDSAAATGAYLQIATATATGAIPIDINVTTATTVDIIDIDVTGVLTGNVFDFATTQAITGNVLELNMTNAVAAAAANITLAGARTDSAIELADSSTSNSPAYLHAISGVRTGTAMTFDVNADMTADVMSFLLASQTTGNGAISIDEEGAAKAGYCIQITKDSTGASAGLDLNCSGAGSGALIDIDVSAVYTGNLIDVAYSAAGTGNAIELNMTTAVAAAALNITAAGVRTDSLIEITDSSTGAVPMILYSANGAGSGDLLDFSVGAVLYTGDVISMSMGATAVGAQCLVIDSTAAHTGALLSAVVNADHTAGLLSLQSDSTSATGHLITLTGHADGNFTSDAININLDGSQVASSALFVTSDAAHNTPFVYVNMDGNHTVPALQVESVTTDTGGHLLGLSATAGGTFAADAININLDTGAVGARALYATSDEANTVPFVLLDMDGAHQAAVLEINSAGTHANGTLLTLQPDGAAAFTSDALWIDMDAAAVTAQAMFIESDIAFTNSLIDIATTTSAATAAAFRITNTGVGAAGVPAGSWIAGSGTLVAGADQVSISHGGDCSSTSNILALSAPAGTHTAGSYALEINAGASNMEGALFTVGKIAAGAAAWTIADVASGASIPVLHNGVCAMTSAGAETRLIAIPSFMGQEISLICDTYVGDIVITVASAVNQTGNNTLTFGVVNDSCTLTAMTIGGTLAWRLTYNDGVALSTV